GLGAGWSADEFHAVGAKKSQRGRLLDETLDVLEAVWGPDPVSYHGPRAVIDDAYVQPKPAHRIPVMLGGLALDRIARRADGWLPLVPARGAAGATAVAEQWARIRELAAEYGRDPSAMEMIVVGNVNFTDGRRCAAFEGTVDHVLEDIAAAQEAGADELI